MIDSCALGCDISCTIRYFLRYHKLQQLIIASSEEISVNPCEPQKLKLYGASHV